MPTPARPVWIISRSSDLAFVIGGALVAFALLAAHAWLGVAAVTIYMAWVLAIDGPHVFATISRTYLDADERRKRGPLLRGSLAFFVLGPLPAQSRRNRPDRRGRAVRRLLHARIGRPVHWTKLFFVAAATSVSIVLFAPPVVAHVQYEAIVPIVTSFHDVQYLAIVWFYHRNRSTGRARRRDAAPAFVRRLSVFLGLGVLFTLAYRVGLGCLASAWPGCDVGAENVALPAGLTLSDLGVAFLWGFALHHYYLDQRIWHVRREQALGRRLRLDEAA